MPGGRLLLAHAWRPRAWRRWLTHPHEDTRILLHPDTLAVNEFLLQVLQGRIIELEVPLEHPVGDPTAALQHREGLIHHLFKGHRCVSPSPGMPCHGDVSL